VNKKYLIDQKLRIISKRVVDDPGFEVSRVQGPLDGGKSLKC
jgi:hypothetical protein